MAKKSKKPKRRHLNVGDWVLGGRYQIVEIVALKGMANVYKIKDNSLEKYWCLKEIVKSDTREGRLEYRSLIREANILKNLNNNSIVRITEMVEEPDCTYIVEDWVSGRSLQEILNNDGAIPEALTIKYCKQLVSVMEYLHNQKNIIYRDLKPDNIIVQNSGNIILLDFGISEVLTGDPEKDINKDNVGTKGYAAPEQEKRNTPLDKRSDIYSFGWTMYTMLTRVAPNVAKRTVKDSANPISERIPTITPGLDIIFSKCIQDSLEDRYESFEEIEFALSNLEKLDSKYKEAQIKKLKTTLLFFSVSIICLVLGLIMLALHFSQQDSIYENLVRAAESSGRYEDYVAAIEIKPAIAYPYIGLIDAIKQDGVFTKDEENQLMTLINTDRTSLEKDKNFGQLAFNIGKLYWFYYEGEDGESVSTTWFKLAMDKGFQADISKVFYDLGSFKKNIAAAQNESSDSGMYKEYWDNLQKAKEIDSGEITELRVYLAIADIITNSSFRLRKDGVTKDQLLAAVNDIYAYLGASSPTSEKSQALYNELAGKVGSLTSIINLAYE